MTGKQVLKCYVTSTFKWILNKSNTKQVFQFLQVFTQINILAEIYRLILNQAERTAENYRMAAARILRWWS